MNKKPQAAEGGDSKPQAAEKVAAVKTVKMVCPDPVSPEEKKTADVHPEEVENWTAAGWRKAE